MVGLDLLVGYVAGWAWRRARQASGRVQPVVDAAIDARVDQLCEVIAAKLGGDPALARLEEEAGSQPETLNISARTRQRVQLALEDALETDEDFAKHVQQLVDDLPAGGGLQVQYNAARDQGTVIAPMVGSVTVYDDRRGTPQ